MVKCDGKDRQFCRAENLSEDSFESIDNLCFTARLRIAAPPSAIRNALANTVRVDEQSI